MKNNEKKVLLMIEDIDDDMSTSFAYKDMIEGAVVLKESLQLDKCILVFHSNFEDAQAFMNENCDAKFQKATYLVQDFMYETYGDNGSLYLGFEHIGEDDTTLVECEPSLCFEISDDEENVINADELTILKNEAIAEFELEMEEYVNRVLELQKRKA